MLKKQQKLIFIIQGVSLNMLYYYYFNYFI